MLLFAYRARATTTSLALIVDNAEAAALVCSRLDGLPTPASGNFYAGLRIYGPDPSVLDGAWQAPALELVS